MTALPVGALMNGIGIFLGDAEELPGGIIADEFMKRAVPNHDRRIAKPVIEIIPPHLPVPQRVIAKSNKRH